MIGNKFFGVSKKSSVDADAQAFIAAAGITDGTQQSAINTLVTDLKGYGLWTKMKAIYPFVGGTADTHKWNLKDPRDLDAAYRWTYIGTDALTHSSNGIKANGVSLTTTHLKTTDFGLNNFSGTVYARDLNITISNSDFGDYPDSSSFYLCIRYSGYANRTISNINQSGLNDFGLPNATTDVGLWTSTRIASNDLRVFKNGVQFGTTNTTASTSSSGGDIVFGGSSAAPCIKEYAFMCFGEGLNTTENANLYTAVQAFQTTLGRAISTTDVDAQAFIDAAGITDYTQQTAINNLVLDLKGYGLWNKMKAVYPFVGGTADTHKWNLKDPRDLDAAFRLTFNGTMTHSSTGVNPDGSTAYADTHLLPYSDLTSSNLGIGMYSRENTSPAVVFDMGTANVSTFLYISPNYGSGGYTFISRNTTATVLASTTEADTRGFYTSNKIGDVANGFKIYKNGILRDTKNGVSGVQILPSVYLFAMNAAGVAANFTDREFAFAWIGSGLDETENANLYTAVQAFQTTLGRQV